MVLFVYLKIENEIDAIENECIAPFLPLSLSLSAFVSIYGKNAKINVLLAEFLLNYFWFLWLVLFSLSHYVSRFGNKVIDLIIFHSDFIFVNANNSVVSYFFSALCLFSCKSVDDFRFWIFFLFFYCFARFSQLFCIESVHMILYGLFQAILLLN